MKRLFFLGLLSFTTLCAKAQDLTEQISLDGTVFYSEDTVSISSYLNGRGNAFIDLPEIQGSGWYFQVLNDVGDVLVEEEIESSKVSVKKIQARARKFGRVFFVNGERKIVLHFDD